jgi:hypothetical protein
MSCKTCNLIQDDFVGGDPEGVIYVRIGEGNLMVSGCNEHLTELLVRVREKTEKMDDRDHRILLVGFLHGVSMQIAAVCPSAAAKRIADSIDRIVAGELEQLPEVTSELKTTFLRNFESKP